MPAARGEPGTLRRNLSVWEAIGVSLALMAPSMAANINPQGTAAVIGRAVPLGYALATAGVLLISYTFVRLCQRFQHSGSVYGFVGATLGPRWGVVSGWALMGTYLAYSLVGAMAAGVFGTAFLHDVGAMSSVPDRAPLGVGLLVLGAALWIGCVPARNATRALLAIEGATVLLILVICGVVLTKLADGSAPHGRGVDLSVFQLPSGTPTGAVFLGVVFGFLSFAGFEGAATLGEEARNPKRDIPRAMLGTALFGGVFFVVVTAVEVMGFGTGAADTTRFVGSGSLLGDLGTTYLAGWIGDLVTLGASVSAFAACLASLVGAGRILYSFSRDGVVPRRLSVLSARHETPVAASGAVAAAGALVIAVVWACGGKAFDLFLATGTIGTLVLLVAYALATFAAGRLLFDPAADVRRAEVVIPAAAIGLLAYTVYRNVVPYPTGTAYWYPIAALAWFSLGVAVVLARPYASRSAGRQLSRDENLTRTDLVTTATAESEAR